jgi:hypothetical protein
MKKKGEFRNKKKERYRIYTYKNGEFYKGEWLNN